MTNPNPQLHTARTLVEQTGVHVFLTGKAGTGKTTFLRDLKAHSPKRMMVTAPTGVAAINAGGVTLHSFFQLPFGPYIPGTRQAEHNRFSKEKINIIRSLHLLVIDEISMVRADMLDAVDAVLRRFRDRNKPFGGVQLLLIGDLYQLPPVVKDSDWQLLQQHYANPYFFASQALAQSQWVQVELQQVYRQSDPAFISLLNQVRNNQLDDQALDALNRRYQPDFHDDDYIVLSTHNHSADKLNNSKLAALPGELQYFEARVNGDYPEQSYPAAAQLALKVGAQVMFIRNDQGELRRYFNGKRGVVSRVQADKVWVQCADEPEPIEVEAATWENIKYGLDGEQQISEDVIGSFSQIPLRLAWAITIHKSQGLTFDKAIIDGQAAFSHGQIYVALSRCRQLDGLVLQSPLRPQAVRCDELIIHFSQHCPAPDAAMLEQAKGEYQQGLLLESFDFSGLGFALNRLERELADGGDRVQSHNSAALPELKQAIQNNVVAVATKFQRQLHSLFASASLPEQDRSVQERVSKASGYFSQALTELITWRAAFHYATDNKQLNKQIKKALERLDRVLAEKQAIVACSAAGFNLAIWLQALAKAGIQESKSAAVKSPPAEELSIDDLAHPALFQRLRDWRSGQAEHQQVPAYRIAHQQVLLQIAKHLPGSRQTLLKVHKVGPSTVEKYGEDLLKLVTEYCAEQGLETDPAPLSSVDSAAAISSGQENSTEDVTEKRSTRDITLDLYRQGLNLAQIAEQRGLVPGTVANHLCHFIQSGEIEVQELLPAERIEAIRQAAAAQQDNSLKAVKTALGDEVSWEDIRLALAGQ
ncbi:helix-turn-helix domain-containing protein [Bowmanella denitrificans]|uniref:Helix-turn-helix domain-containing protein n=1 Tax=Bowmanella denitrificans TaxID=366582 RepID=A0ABN0WLR0_9ALTE